jgi:hypothetical protein
MVTGTKFRDDRPRNRGHLPARKFEPVTTFAEPAILLNGFAAFVAATAKDVGRFGFAFAIGAAIIAVRFRVAVATGVGALFRFIHILKIS